MAGSFTILGLLSPPPPIHAGSYKFGAHAEGKHFTSRFIELLHASHSTLHFISSLYSSTVLMKTICGLARNLAPKTKCITWDSLGIGAKADIGCLKLTSVAWEKVWVGRLQHTLESCTNFHHLEVLKMRQIKSTDLSEPRTPDAAITSPNLHFLDLNADGELVSLLSPLSPFYIEPQNLKTVCFGCVSIGNSVLVCQFVQAVGPALHHLALHIRSPQDTDLNTFKNLPISLTQNTNLRTLEVGVFRLRRDLLWFQALIATIISKNFEEFTMWFNMVPEGLKEGSEGFDFESLEQALPRLCVQIVLQHGFSEEFHQSTKGIVEIRLPVLHAKGYFAVDINSEVLSEVLDGWWPCVSDQSRSI
ncbi:hypothetical protein C8J56DRAFT_899173 [Mycena floridula]|nr:hypothetical protein C8J56DRAFT_899173 [Mycena floridula]